MSLELNLTKIIEIFSIKLYFFETFQLEGTWQLIVKERDSLLVFLSMTCSFQIFSLIFIFVLIGGVNLTIFGHHFGEQISLLLKGAVQEWRHIILDNFWSPSPLGRDVIRGLPYIKLLFERMEKILIVSINKRVHFHVSIKALGNWQIVGKQNL